MHLGDGQCCGEKEKDGLVKDDRPWGAAPGAERGRKGSLGA